MSRNEQQHLEINRKKWDRWADHLDKGGPRNEFLRKAQRGVISLLELDSNTSMLDMGCGTGWALGEAARRNNGEGHYYGVDLSEKMIEKARQNFSGLPNFHFIVANSESVPLDDSQLDIIICTNSFHHYFHPINALGEMRRLLRPGGKLYILDPTADTLFVKFLGRVMHIFESSAVKLYSTEEFQELFLMSNLKYLRTEALNRHEKVHIGEK